MVGDAASSDGRSAGGQIESGFRLRPLSSAAWPREVAEMEAGFAGRLNVYRVMAHNPSLLRSWETLRNHLVLNSSLSGRDLEIVILRTGHRWASAYEWAHHVSRGRAVGLSEAQIEEARKPPEAWTGAASDRALMSAVDELLSDGKLSEEGLRRIGGHIDATQLLDLMATVGMYTTLAFIVKTFETPIDDGL